MTRGRLNRAGSGAFPPRTAVEFGSALKQMRQPMSLDVLLDSGPRGADQAHLSKSQLGRFERGNTLPALKHARALDDLYGAGGWVEVALGSMWRVRWNPWRQGEFMPRRLHAVSWPGQLDGLVWLKVVPTTAFAATPHSLRLAWGPWRQDLDVVLPAAGLLLFTGKARDDGDVGVTMNLDADPAVFLLHGAGEDLDGESVYDLRAGWSR